MLFAWNIHIMVLYRGDTIIQYEGQKHIHALAELRARKAQRQNDDQEQHILR